MKYRTLIIICVLSTFTGMLWYAFKQQWIIIQVPPSLNFSSNTRTLERKITLSFWQDEQWHTEAHNLMCPGTTAQTLHAIVAGWITHIHDEGITHKKITLQSALIDTATATAYLSFDRSPLEKEWSTYTKWMLIEGLLKTVREADLSIQSIYFLVRHQPLIDPHLDFSHAWPCTGYVTQ